MTEIALQQSQTVGPYLTIGVAGFEFVPGKPGRVPMPDGLPQAPHIVVGVFARGLLKHLVTRLYFPDEDEANDADPVLSGLGGGGGGGGSTSASRATGRRRSSRCDNVGGRAREGGVGGQSGSDRCSYGDHRLP